MADQFSLKAILSAVDNLSPVLRSVNAAAKGTRKYLGDVGTSMNGLASKFGIPLGIVSTIAAGFGIGAIKKAVVAFTELGEEVQKGAFKAGMSNAEYQRMKYVTEQAGLGAEAMQASMGKLNKNIGAAASGKNKDLVSLFQTLHIPLKGANGQIRSAADMLPQLADAFVKNKDAVKQAAIGNAFFGKSYQEMLPFLNEGSEGIQKSLDRFAKLKGVISDEDLSGAKEFGDKLADLNFVTKGFQMTIAKELVPVLSPMVEQFVQWAAANKKLIGSEVKKVVQELVTAVKSVDWNVFIQGVKDTASSIGGFIEKVGGLKNALIVLAVVMNIQTIAAAVGLIGSLGRLGLALFGVTTQAGLAAASMGAFAASQSVSAALTSSLVSAAKSTGLLGAAALIGVAIGTAIYKVLLEDTRVGDWIGEKIARIAAFFGNEEAKSSLSAMDTFAKTVAPAAAPSISIAHAPVAQASIKPLLGAPLPRVPEPVRKAAGVELSRTPSTMAAVNLAQSQPLQTSVQSVKPPEPANGGKPLGSGVFNLSTPATTVGGSVVVSFKDAPPGMRVEESRATNPRVSVTTDVGYRTLGTGNAF